MAVNINPQQELQEKKLEYNTSNKAFHIDEMGIECHLNFNNFDQI